MSGDWTPRVQCFLEDRKAEKLEQKRRMEEERRQISAYYAMPAIYSNDTSVET